MTEVELPFSKVMSPTVALACPRLVRVSCAYHAGAMIKLYCHMPRKQLLIGMQLPSDFASVGFFQFPGTLVLWSPASLVSWTQLANYMYSIHMLCLCKIYVC